MSLVSNDVMINGSNVDFDSEELSAREAGRVIQRSHESIRRYALQGQLAVEYRGPGKYLYVRVAELKRFAVTYNFVWNEETLQEIVATTQ